MSRLPALSSVAELTTGRDPSLDAWLLHFMVENNLEHGLNPLYNASPEQLRFMVVLAENEVFLPCSDEMFAELIKAGLSPELRAEYLRVWKRVMALVRERCEDRYQRRRIVQFCRHRFKLTLASHMVIPSRLEKRLTSIVLTQTGQEDPNRERKQNFNRRVMDIVGSPSVDRLLSACPDELKACGRIEALRFELEMIELKRLLYLSAWSGLWRGREVPGPEAMARELDKDCEDFDALRRVFSPDEAFPERPNLRKVLYLPSVSGGVLFDILVAKTLLRMNCRVILALKSGFFYDAPTIWDLEQDPVLARALSGAHVIHDERMDKNSLLEALRQHRFVIIPDGTQERLNLYRTSVTFARAWKEADLVIAKGELLARRLIHSGASFTRDIVSFYRDVDGSFRLHYKPKPESVRVFGEGELIRMADEIIAEMREARLSGRKVMFYSAVVGSIPGQTKTAIRVLDTFVNHLRQGHESTYIINPAEHFQPGMDGDDLMYMWERVQRSGLLDIWRFQSVEDIEKSFELMGERVPPAWAGKDSTYSTGCTKEMRIALSVQQAHPELQLIGPDPDRFFRRRDYGVGSYHDAAIPVA